MLNGFLKLNRDGFIELINHPLEFHLLTVIAMRARRTPSVDGTLQPGEALIGDWENMGFSRQNYRRAKANLQAWQIITTKPTNKGTVAKLCDSRFYDINIDDANHQINQQPATNPTSSQPAANQQPTTNKKERKKEGEENPLVFPEGCPDESKAIISEWFSYKDKKKPKLLFESKQKFLDEHSAWDVERLRRAVNFSISNNYQGLFEPKENPKPFTNGHTPAWKLEEQLRNVTEQFKTASESERETLRKQADELKSRLTPAQLRS